MGAVGVAPVSLFECAVHVALSNGIEVHDRPRDDGRVTVQQSSGRVCIAPACSELGEERRLNGVQWERVLARLICDAKEVVVLGGPADAHIADLLIRHGQRVTSGIAWVNACDGRTLAESLHLLAGCSRLIAIDSSLLHFGRLFGIPTVSFWGPTHPMTRLKNSPAATEEVWYEKVPCSPCMHVGEAPPCFGRNICIEAAVRRFCGEDIASIATSPHPPPFVRLERK